MYHGVLSLRSAALVCLMGVVAGCLAPGTARHQRYPMPGVSMQGTGGRDEFEAELKSLSGSRNDSDASETSGRLRIHIGDDSVVQYWLIIENPNADVFTGAHLRRVAGAQKHAVAATLFEDARARDRRLQLRGNLTVGKTGSLPRLIQEVRMHPDSFYVSVRGDAGREVMTGRLR